MWWNGKSCISLKWGIIIFSSSICLLWLYMNLYCKSDVAPCLFLLPQQSFIVDRGRGIPACSAAGLRHPPFTVNYSSVYIHRDWWFRAAAPAAEYSYRTQLTHSRVLFCFALLLVLSYTPTRSLALRHAVSDTEIAVYLLAYCTNCVLQRCTRYTQVFVYIFTMCVYSYVCIILPCDRIWLYYMYNNNIHMGVWEYWSSTVYIMPHGALYGPTTTTALYSATCIVHKIHVYSYTHKLTSYMHCINLLSFDNYV